MPEPPVSASEGELVMETNHTTRVRLAVNLPQPVPGQNDYVNASYDQLLEVAAAACSSWRPDSRRQEQTVSDWDGYRRVAISCAERNAILYRFGLSRRLTVFSTSTDVERGHFFTEWGRPDEDAPRFGDDVRRGESCRHWRYEPDFDFEDDDDLLIVGRVLDGYCGEGGAARGYADAFYSPYGIDNDPARLELYPYPSHLGDVLEVMVRLNAGLPVPFTHKDGTIEWLRLSDFVLIHASPPCQGYSRGTVALPGRLDRYDRLIAVTRELLIESGLPYVIENVEDAKRELRSPLLLCGRMFGLGAIDDDGTPLVLDRHRLFESNVTLLAPNHQPHDRSVQVAGVYSGARRDKYEARYIRKGGYVPPNLAVLRELIGAPWMSEKGCFLSIPPVYTAFLGEQLWNYVEVAA